MKRIIATTIRSETEPCNCSGGACSRLEKFLLDSGAREFRHAHRRTLYDHLLGTREILQRWRQPRWMQDAGAVHSVYSTEAYHKQLVPLEQRKKMASIAGERAERLAYLFCVVPRETFWQAIGPDGKASSAIKERPVPKIHEPMDAAEVQELLILHMANFAEQARGPGGGPGRWLARVSGLGSLLDETRVVVPPIFDSCTQIVAPEAENRAHRSYLAGLSAGNAAGADARLADASRSCPWLAEPYVIRAYLALQEGNLSEAGLLAARADRALSDIGVPWDPRLSYSDWHKLALLIGDLATHGTVPEGLSFDIQRAHLLIESLEKTRASIQASRSDADAVNSTRVARFHRYVDSFAQAPANSKMLVYPGLNSKPWYDPTAFPLALALSTHYTEIRNEMLQLRGKGFHRESERIKRSGAWDVYFFYERGRKNAENCGQCPITTSLIEAHDTVRTHAGLIYFSRMKPGTHIAAHRGPTNLRLRCHLGLQVPEGDCRIRVGNEARSWSEGECLIFDDYFNHEAWNRARSDRIVLIVDFWHPSLSPEEVELLKGLHHYAYETALSLERYWSANQRSARGGYH